MDATLHALASLLVEAIPTVLFFVFLCVYLNFIFFKPLANVLEKRRKETEGVRDLAQRAFEEADNKTSQFDRAIQLARAEIAQEHEALRRQWAAEQVTAVDAARTQAAKQIEDVKRQIAEEVEQAKGDMDTSIDRLSAQIVETLVKRRAA
jgi:F0F1-type ATP synthase membrane subunit b/b'